MMKDQAPIQTVRVQAGDFDPGAEIARLSEGAETGAVVSFTGHVRGGTGADAIDAMELEHWPGVTEEALERIVEAAEARWPLSGVTVIHRHGRLEPGARIVLVVTASRHRGAAFEAAEFLMDYLKTDAPFWKKEHRRDGTARWVDARESDGAAQRRWQMG